jgi:hypothetical protein
MNTVEFLEDEINKCRDHLNWYDRNPTWRNASYVSLSRYALANAISFAMVKDYSNPEIRALIGTANAVFAQCDRVAQKVAAEMASEMEADGTAWLGEVV